MQELKLSRLSLTLPEQDVKCLYLDGSLFFPLHSFILCKVTKCIYKQIDLFL